MTQHEIELDTPGAIPEPDGETTKEEFLANNPGEETLAEDYFPEVDPNE